MSVMQGTVIVKLVMSKELRDVLLTNGGSEAIRPTRLIPHWQSADTFEMVVTAVSRWEAFTADEINSIIQAAQGDIWGTDIDGLEREMRAELARREAKA